MIDSRRISTANERAPRMHLRTRAAERGASFLWALGLLLSVVAASPNAGAQNLTAPALSVRAISFDRLPGWGADDLTQAWPAFLANCQVMRQRLAPWANACAQADQVSANDSAQLRGFFEANFKAFEIISSSGQATGMITGYYEPLVRGSRTPGGPYQFPLYKAPADLIHVDLSAVYPELRSLRLRGRLENNRVLPYPTRGEIESKGLLKGQELMWLDDAIDAFFLQVQGSGRVVLTSGETVRIGYAEQNGHPYRSIGRWLIDSGELKPHEASMQGIKSWLAKNPGRREELLHQNPSLVFFKELNSLGPDDGPPGSMGVPLRAGRSLAVDPSVIAMGTLVFLDTRIPGSAPGDNGVPFQRLMIAQDTGSAIVGIHRGDIFFGTGDKAGEIAGRMRSPGTMYVLLPL